MRKNGTSFTYEIWFVYIKRVSTHQHQLRLLKIKLAKMQISSGELKLKKKNWLSMQIEFIAESRCGEYPTSISLSVSFFVFMRRIYSYGLLGSTQISFEKNTLFYARIFGMATACRWLFGERTNISHWMNSLCASATNIHPVLRGYRFDNKTAFNGMWHVTKKIRFCLCFLAQKRTPNEITLTLFRSMLILFPIMSDAKKIEIFS